MQWNNHTVIQNVTDLSPYLYQGPFPFIIYVQADSGSSNTTLNFNYQCLRMSFFPRFSRL